MAIKNFSLTGVGPTVTFGKGGGTITSSGTNLQIGGSTISTAATLATALADYTTTAGLSTYLDTNNYATETFVNTQVQAFAAGLDFKNSVRIATTANITTSGTQTIDGVAVIAGDRVLVKNQDTGSQNGIYIVDAGAWSRSTDASSTGSITGGTFVFVEEGTTNADTSWVVSTDDTITIGSTAIVWTQFGAGGGSTPVAGNGISVSGSTVTANVDGTTLTNTGGTGAQLAVRGGTSGQVLKSAGAGADATWGTIAYSELTGTLPTLDSLSNVTITSNSTGEILKWNGTAWINNTLTEAGILGLAGGAMVSNADITFSGGGEVLGLPAEPSATAAASKEYVDAQIATVSGGGIYVYTVALDNTSVSGNVYTGLPINSVVHRAAIRVTTPFDGTAALTIGADPSTTNIEDGTGSDLTANGVYVIDTYYIMAATTDVIWTMTGTPTVGAASLIVEYSLA